MNDLQSDVNDLQSNVNSLQKHTSVSKKTSSKKRQCIYCNAFFSSASSLSTHRKKCKHIPIMVTLKKEELDALKQKETTLSDEIERLKRSSAKLETDNKELLDKVDTLTERLIDNSDKYADKFAEIAVTSTATASKTVSVLTYIMANFRNAPELKPIRNLSAMTIDFDSNTDFVENVISLFKNKKLISNIGDFIVDIYQKEDSQKQSLWNSDVSRVSYYISEELKKNETTWTADKNGVKVGKLIIRPALDRMKKLLQTYTQEGATEILKGGISDQRQNHILNNQQSANEIIKIINNRTLEQAIVKYIAPELYLNSNRRLKNDNIKEITHVKVNNKVKIVNKPKRGRPAKKKVVTPVPEPSDYESNSDN